MSVTSSVIHPTGAGETSTGLSGFARRSANLVSALRRILGLWHERATLRPQLALLNDHLLRDAGLTRAEADYEAAKPFWQA